MVLYSMCASSGDASPRGIEFLFSKNRLNVAISRAQTLAVVVGNRSLARTRCGTLGQMQLGERFLSCGGTFHHYQSGWSDGTRMRDLLRHRQTLYLALVSLCLIGAENQHHSKASQLVPVPGELIFRETQGMSTMLHTLP